jgi:hypothetical protein
VTCEHLAGKVAPSNERPHHSPPPPSPTSLPS